MTPLPILRVYRDSAEVATAVADQFFDVLTSVLAEGSDSVAHISLTGGTMGGKVLREVAESSRRSDIDWSRVHFWWSDERYLLLGDPDRNETQSREALLDELRLSEAQIHGMPALGADPSLEDAAHSYRDELAVFSVKDHAWPRFDILLLGVGGDGHIASLFPGHALLHDTEHIVLAEADSPKPPSARITLTLPVINSADRIWCVLTGADKAHALQSALSGGDVDETPAAGVRARLETVFFADNAAAEALATE
ncbi:MAG TPA: 6-phosphogluconolactonase [Pseudolysinimonas sp.]|nr:6-phosphogluconolactonase [Pseudolysinimonas sp.]